MNEELKNKVEQLVKSKHVFLVMKGTPQEPYCGFSNKVAQLLKQLNIDFGYFNIFDDEELTHAIKEWANWPTTPQLYIDGKLVGGCDITMQLYANGELQKMLA